jgi:membrane-bound ClpP family serine protease
MDVEAFFSTIFQNLPALILVVLGFALVLLEMYTPGFGLPGILGSLSLIGGVALFARSVSEALIIALVIVALLCVALLLSIRSAASGRLARSRLVLREVAVPTVEEKDLTFLVGKRGEARTALRPAGIAEFDGARLNVVSDGQWIEAGMPLRVERVEGNRIVVSLAEDAAPE